MLVTFMKLQMWRRVDQALWSKHFNRVLTNNNSNNNNKNNNNNNNNNNKLVTTADSTMTI